MVDGFQKLLELQADSIADIPLRIPFLIYDSSMLPEDFPIKKEVIDEDEKMICEIIIEPQKVGTFFRMYPLISRIKEADLEKIIVNEKKDFDKDAPKVIADYGDVLVDIICIGIHNKKGTYPSFWPEFIRENCTWKDIHFFLNAILFRIGTMAFTDSTTLLKKVGPGAAEKIALQKNLESWKEQMN